MISSYGYQENAWENVALCPLLADKRPYSKATNEIEIVFFQRTVADPRWWYGHIEDIVYKSLMVELNCLVIWNKVNYWIIGNIHQFATVQSESFAPPPDCAQNPASLIVKATSNDSVALRETILASITLTRYDWQITLRLLQTISPSRAMTAVEQRTRAGCP